MKVLHIPARVNAEVAPVLSENLASLAPYPVIGLVATAQHLHELASARRFLEENDKTVVDCGQVLGCDASNALAAAREVDCFIYIGSGRFHPLAIAIETKKPVYIANPISNAFEEIPEEEKTRWRKKRKGRITKAAAAETLGVIVSTKSGQFNKKTALDVKKRLEAAGKKAFLFAGDFLSPENLMAFRVSAYVNTACPRIAEDEHEKPVVTVEEVREWLP